MTQVDNPSATLTAVEDWQDTAAERGEREALPVARKSKFVRFFEALRASMAMSKGQKFTAAQQQAFLPPADIVVQNYPYIYLQSMGG